MEQVAHDSESHGNVTSSDVLKMSPLKRDGSWLRRVYIFSIIHVFLSFLVFVLPYLLRGRKTCKLLPSQHLHMERACCRVPYVHVSRLAPNLRALFYITS